MQILWANLAIANKEQTRNAGREREKGNMAWESIELKYLVCGSQSENIVSCIYISK